MKKSLVALAALSAVSAFADVDVSGGIKLYGVLDQALMSQTVNTAAGATRSATGLFAAAATSRFGVKGERNLNDNLKAFIQTEIQLEADSAGLIPNDKNRGTFVGLDYHNVGTVKLGTMETMAYETFNNDVNGRVEYKPQVWRFTAGADMVDRTNNSLRLTSSKIQGFTASYLRGFAEVTDAGGTAQTNDYNSFGINYNDGGALTGALVTDSIVNVAGKYKLPGYINKGTVSGDTPGAATAVQWATAGQNTPLKRTIGSLSYDFGIAKLNYIMANASVDGATGGTFNTNTFGVRVPMDQFTIALSYGSGAYTANAAANATGTVSDTTFGAYYSFDKATSAYLLTSAGKNTTASAGTAANGVVGSGSTKTTAIGLRYNF